MLLIYAEFNRPGTVVLGCSGALAVMLGIGGLEHLAVSGDSLALVLAGIALVCLGCCFPMRGLLPLAGALCLGYSLAKLTTPAMHLAVAIGAAATFSSVTTWLGRVAMLARRKKMVPGPWDRVFAPAIPIGTPVERVD
jgi:membrane-bound ClpP family serine protease